jgi:hypothetical protein
MNIRLNSLVVVGVLLLIVGTGCQGGEAPVEGDNPAAAEAVQAQENNPNVPVDEDGPRGGPPGAERSGGK